MSKNKSSKIKFQLINNIIVMPVQLNGVELSFVLDTGVSKPILFNIANLDSLQIKNTQRSFLRGLGKDGVISAIKSKGNILRIGEAIAVNKEISMVFDPSINFTPRLGVPVHGIIGYDIFKDFVVEINYNNKFIKLYKPDNFKLKTSKSRRLIPIEIINKKPYLDALVTTDGKETSVKLLMDTGSSDALWLFEKSKFNITVPTQFYFEDFLGKGLSGPVYGKRSKIDTFVLTGFELENVNVAYPDSSYLAFARRNTKRNGSISGNLLKRFNWFLDYKNNRAWLKKNSAFKSNFYYNNSGIVLEQLGFRVAKQLQKTVRKDGYGRKVEGSVGLDLIDKYKFVLKPNFQVVELRENSNAKAAGIKIDDVVIAINGKETSDLTLQQVNQFFYDKKGTVLRLRVDRNGQLLYFKFQLDDVFKKKSLQTEDSSN
ncbi:aspartyl protease family protein [Winogradskyella litorisediminis]|uniref:Aspartyl protease family protein n=1 Tax=Winogradskyella litorisediminis TaxID=1156618 RepID=A0ABW3NAA6_9FLAO